VSYSASRPARPDAEPEGRHGDDGGEGGDASKGGVEFRAEKAGIVQGSVGKASFGDDKIAENVRAFVDAVNRAKPSGAKGHYLLRASVSSTMGPGVKLDLSTLQTAGAAAE